MGKIKIECTEEQKKDLIGMISSSGLCKFCPAIIKCDKYCDIEDLSCFDLLSSEIDWIIR